MEFELRDRRLNLFQHFSGDTASENNTTRAFLVVLGRSPWSPVILRGFLDLLAEKPNLVKQGVGVLDSSLSRRWPDGIEMWMQQGFVSTDFLAGVGSAILVELTPVLEGPDAAKPPPSVTPGGIADAVIVLRFWDEDGENRSVAIVVESKLYGRAGEEQIGRYLAAMKDKVGEKHAWVHVSWDEAYQLTNALPVEAQFDPIVRDFKAFIDSRPYLVRFTGFQEADFQTPESGLDVRLARCCERLMSELEGGRGAVEGAPACSPERKKGGRDYDLPLDGQNRLWGNLGLASWRPPELAVKLVVGSRRNWETSLVLSRTANREDVQRLLKRAAETRRFKCSVAVRLYFHRFDDVWLFPWDGVVVEDAPQRWKEAMGIVESFHRKTPTDDLLTDLEAKIGTGGAEAEQIERAKRLPLERRPRLFCVVVLTLVRDGIALARDDVRSQIRVLREDLELFAALLRALSAES